MRMPSRETGREDRPRLLATPSAVGTMRSPRRGAAMVLVVACLATFSLIALAMLRGSLASRGQLRSEHHLRQAGLLLDATVARAEARYAAGGLAAFSAVDDMQEVPADEITGTAPARLSLSLDEEQGQWLLTVVCTYPATGPRAVRRSRVVVLPAPTPAPSEPDDSPSPEPASTQSSPEETLP